MPVPYLDGLTKPAPFAPQLCIAFRVDRGSVMPVILVGNLHDETVRPPLDIHAISDLHSRAVSVVLAVVVSVLVVADRAD